ncbi:hypothetical protein [Runella zeae]|uniref:hypothetical protein n=1 Tax=Runella zeae TaxID=94255 RepID=UPI00146ED527|nr:hypothetical protein [Runella zeae]
MKAKRCSSNPYTILRESVDVIENKDRSRLSSKLHIRGSNPANTQYRTGINVMHSIGVRNRHNCDTITIRVRKNLSTCDSLSK